MLSSEGLIDRYGSEGPLCPNGMLPPVDPLHALRVQMINAVYDATPRDEDGEPATPDLQKVNTAAAYGSDTIDRMRLYRNSVPAQDTAGPVAVEVLFFRCGICGLTLPAARTPVSYELRL